MQSVKSNRDPRAGKLMEVGKLSKFADVEALQGEKSLLLYKGQQEKRDRDTLFAFSTTMNGKLVCGGLMDSNSAAYYY